ncbi:lysophospholipase [Gordonia sp. HY002]|uniref:alpha/beta fold hydrolase n=1 Tax=Gordonia zhenghanii TaxID=2911516 RepID=UPI001EF0BDF6|nr:alpha/beta fold hydrolase [Gordonia zhenghanii]MCF8572050.1 lysophospholipase [Gordonia zhenghanii]MCF8602924.1 lysophospholipase [Gordonia zhenghanii]
MALTELSFPSHNGRDTVYGWLYHPTRPARGIVQLIHGLGEHSRRYLHLITTLLDAGFAVVADDHAGHGKTAAESGFWVETGDDGAATAVADEVTLFGLARAAYPDLPYIVFGHSWGSMIARPLASRIEIDGLILCGVAAQMPGAESVVDRAALAAEPDQSGPADARYVEALFTGFGSRYGDSAGPTAWVARDEDVVRDHGTDPLNNFGAPMSVRFVRGFVDLYHQANADDWYSSVRDDLPVLILAGDQDPVANFGEGAYHVANRLVSSGQSDVRTRVYSGFRHEVHNEPEIRDDVEAEIVAFAEKLL